MSGQGRWPQREPGRGQHADRPLDALLGPAPLSRTSSFAVDAFHPEFVQQNAACDDVCVSVSRLVLSPHGVLVPVPRFRTALSAFRSIHECSATFGSFDRVKGRIG